MRRIFAIPVLLAGFSAAAFSAVTTDPPAPTADRVGFPKDYRETYTLLRRVNRTEKQQVVTVYGNHPAATIQRPGDLPYPYGSIIVMETAGARKDAQGKPLLDAEGYYRKDQVVGLHVMRREKGFGAAYGKNRTGEWEYAEYRADQSYITPPQKSFACASATSRRGDRTSSTAEGFRPSQGRNEVPEHGTDSDPRLTPDGLVPFPGLLGPRGVPGKSGILPMDRLDHPVDRIRRTGHLRVHRMAG